MRDDQRGNGIGRVRRDGQADVPESGEEETRQDDHTKPRAGISCNAGGGESPYECSESPRRKQYAHTHRARLFGGVPAQIHAKYAIAEKRDDHPIRA